MLFNSYAFATLLAATLAAYWQFERVQYRLWCLLLASLVFYGWLHWPSIGLLLATIALNYWLGLMQERRQSRGLLAVAMALNLAPLLWFKYAAFGATELNRLMMQLEWPITVPLPHRWLPLGISFFTFQIIAYQVDVYRREIPAEKNILVFAVFKSFFAQLIAGPIVRARDLLPELKQVQPFRAAWFHRGLFLLVAGLFLKIGVADVLAQFAVDAFDQPAAAIAERSTSESWLGLYAYAFQLFADFWGYSTVAVGVGLLFGIKLPINFHLPYFAYSLQDFWRRWHITLSNWFRDYLYIPLGGGKAHVSLNLMFTMALAGVWHGAGWNFILWGALHGLWLALERLLGVRRPPDSRWARGLRTALVFHGVCLLWVLFRARSMETALAYWSRLLLPPYSFNPRVPEILAVWLVGFGVLMVPLSVAILDERWPERPLSVQVAASLGMLAVMFGYGGARFDFVYFSF